MSVKGIVFAIFTYLIIFYIFDPLFGNTPVIILNISGKNGYANLLINLTSYGIITFSVLLIFSFFNKNNNVWIKSNALGIFIAIIATLCFISIYINLIWK